LVSLALLIIENQAKYRPQVEDKSDLADEERSEIHFAVLCAQNMLSWLSLTVEQAKEFVNGQGKYYSGGVEEIEIPPVVEGMEDPIFPPIAADE
jgi:hypothetical protein